jgi:hypothetical protein
VNINIVVSVFENVFCSLTGPREINPAAWSKVADAVQCGTSKSS